ncbi:MAG TPA: hypothetical protein VKB59_09280 [Micromonosporaceae bacterium]|nr:hypothetical protein [Micromonosporaceae bacterium]
MNLHPHTETAATPRSRFARRAAMLGVATAAIIGVAAGPAAAANSPTRVPLPASAVVTAYAQTDQAARTAPTAPSTAMTVPVAQAPVPHAPAPKAPAKKAPVAVPSRRTLLPKGMPSNQSSFKLNATQRANAAAIVKAGRDLRLPPRAMVMAVACSMQESTLHNYGNLGNRNDHDSLGLFQQRPSSGWGSPSQVTNAHHAAQSFYKRLVAIHGWKSLPLTVAIQKVQVSAFPQAYAKWEKFAASVVGSVYAANAAQAAAHAAQAVPAPGR